MEEIREGGSEWVRLRERDGIERVSLSMRWCVGSPFLTASLGFMSK